MEIRIYYLTIYIIYYSMISIYCNNTKNFQLYQCRNNSRHNGIPYELEMECPDERPVIQVKISSFKRIYSHTNTSKNQKIDIQIQCSINMKPQNYSLLPNLNFGDIYEVNFKKCPLPLGTPIIDIIRRFGNPNVVRFQFTAEEDETILPIHLKDLNEVQRLQLKNVVFTGSSKELFANLTNLQWMDLRYTNAINIPKDIFEPLINLTTLELGGSKLKKLFPGMLTNQKKLTKLNLWGNNLSTLPVSIFEGAISIKDLDLMSNNFETFYSNSFSLLKNLKNINLSGNCLRSLPENLFSQNNLLELIKIQSNRVDLIRLPSRLFSNLKSLTQVTLLKDGIHYLSNDLFMNSTNVEIIEIIGNKIKELPSNIVKDQINLKLLNLSNNELKVLNDFIFVYNKRLKILDISYNQLVTLSLSVFSGLDNLEKLMLHNNKFVNFEPETMIPLVNLNEIYLQNNQLNFYVDLFGIGSPLHKLSNIKVINLQNNSISRIYPDWYAALLQLNYLDLSFNNITFLRKEDLQFTNPHLILNLTYNNISTINLDKISEQYEVYAVPDSIIKIDINNNPLNCDCGVTTFSSLIKKASSFQNLSNHLVFEYDNLKCNKNLDGNWPYNLSGRHIANVNSFEFVCPQKFPCADYCTCWFRKFDHSVIVNCSHSELREVPLLFDTSDESFQWIELHIENNNIQNLPTLKDIGYDKVQELYAQNNNIINVESENIPSSLRILNLVSNKLQKLNSIVLNTINRTRTIHNISLSGNPWQCNCDTANFIFFVQSRHQIVTDIEKIKCEDDKQIVTLTFFKVCSKTNTLIITTCIVLVLLAIFFGGGIAVYFKYQLEFKLWLFDHNLFLNLITEEELDKNKKYDAFISYSHKDEHFVTDELIPALENGIHPFKLCLHMRDWVPGEWIQNQIQDSVENSRRTIVVLSENFLESIWGQVEFRTAHTAALAEGRARVIVIIYGEIGDVEKLDPKLKVYLKMNTYVRWGDPWFWNKLRYAMPHTQHMKLKKTKGLSNTTVKSYNDDKLELMKTVSFPFTSTSTTQKSTSLHPNLTQLTSKSNIPNINDKSLTAEYANLSFTVEGILNKNLTQKNKLEQISQLNYNGHRNSAFVININSKQSDV